MPEEDVPQTRLRIGGWLPSYKGPARVGRAEPVPGPAGAQRSDPAPPTPRPAAGRAVDRAGTSPPRRRLALAAVPVVTALVLFGVASVQRGGVEPATRNRTATGAAVVIPPEWATSPPAGGPTSAAHPTDLGATTRPTGGTKPAAPARTASGGPAATPAAPSPSTAGPAAVALNRGARVGLEPVTHAGYRVRHYNFTGRIDPIGADSGSVAKADATFTVRAGLAASGCLSFEAVNYPGYYLRHQDFRLHLHRRDGTALYAADATFCAVTGLTGQHVSLRSYNYPDRYLRHRQSRLEIGTVDGGAARAAMTFIVRHPL